MKKRFFRKKISIKKFSTKWNIMDKFKNLKIVHSIVFILIFKILFLGIIGGVGYYAFKQIYYNTDIIYNNRLLPIIKIGELKNNIYMLKYNISKGMDSKFYYEYDKEVEKITKTIDNLLKEYENSKIDENEVVYINKFKEDYKKYIDVWEDIKKTLSNQESIKSDQKTKLHGLENNIENYLDGLIKYNKLVAEKLKKDSYKIYIKNLRLYLIIVIVAVVLLLSFMLIIIRVINKSLKDMIHILTKISQGDFTENIDTDKKNEFGIMNKALSKTIRDISEMIQLVKLSSQQISAYSNNLSKISEKVSTSYGEVLRAIQEISQGSVSQANDLDKISRALNKFGEELEVMIKNIQDISKNTKKTANMAKESDKKLGLLIDSIYGISHSFSDVSKKIALLSERIDKINEITKMINDVAEQTNLLALNAAIEAARVGESGKGFTVVAEEIRKLAEETKEASRDINRLIEDILIDANVVTEATDNVNNDLTVQVNSIETTIDSFKEIIKVITIILPIIENISNSVLYIKQEKDNIITNVEEVLQIAEENSASSQQISASSEEVNIAAKELASTSQILNQMIMKLNEQINKFKLQEK
ncbi:methyl-accepting chemotaxis protein [Caloranaerobacter sp. DY30410]|uniref:methyl-accepting chemotaxis protein n=1 Tax=Caloranaerobacter sp. DY30410 TaxID=3238305 RepID=UPI003CFC257B